MSITRTWERVIDAICHYVKKIVTLVFNTTPNDSRRVNFNSFVNKIEAQRVSQYHQIPT